MRRPPNTIPSAVDRAPPEQPRATTRTPARSRVQRAVTRSVVRRHRDGRGRVHRAARTARQPVEHRLRNQETTAQRQKVRLHE